MPKLQTIFEQDITKKTVNALCLSIAAVSMIMIVIYMLLSPLSGDDLTYYVQKYFSYDWIINERYLTWSSRIYIESFMPFLCRNLLIAKAIALIMIMSVPFAFKLIAGYDSSKVPFYVCVCVLAFIPCAEMASAGFVATICNYLFPAVAALWITALLLKEDLNFAQILLLIFCIPLACDHEQSLLLVLTAVFLMLIDKRNIPRMFTLAIAVIFLLKSVLCPGNALRVVQESQNWLPEFLSFTLYDKVYMGITTALYNLCYSYNQWLTAGLCLMIIAVTKRLWSAVAVLVAMYFILRQVRHMFNDSGLHASVKWLTTFPPECIVLLSLVAFTGVVLIVLSNLNFKQKTSVLSFYLLGFGLAALMGFSPTVFASAVRPIIFSQMLFPLLGLYLIVKSNASKPTIVFSVAACALFHLYKFTAPEIYRLILSCV